MNFRSITFLLLVVLMATSCQKNEMSKIPQIDLLGFGPSTITVNKDTLFMNLSLTDGDADLGNAANSGKYDIYVKDFRFDTGYRGFYFPTIDAEIKDPNKGLKGTCLFMFTSYILMPRLDSIHIVRGDTTRFEVYVMDKAGNQSNHILTEYVIMKI